MASKIHVVLLPHPAFGHMIPFHQLAIALAESGVHVSYIATPRNTQRLPKPPQSLSPLLNFVSFPLPVLESNPLPEGAEATVDVPGHQIQHLAKAFDLLREPFEKFVVEHSPDWLIVDFIVPWATDVGRDCGVPVLGFAPFSDATSLFFGLPEYLTGEGQRRVRSSVESLMSPPEWVTFPSSVVYRRFEAIGLHARLLVEKGLAIEVERREDGSFARNDIAESLNRAMVSEEGQGIRARAREAAAVFGDQKLHDQYIADFADYLKHEAVKED